MTSPMNRRGLLTTLGKAFGAGGLMLSGSRPGALALPLDIGPAAQIPLTATPLPVSDALRRWRQLTDELHSLRQEQHARARARDWNVDWGDYSDEWHRRSLIIDEVASPIANRANPTWADCVELAEVCWRALPKEELPNPLGSDYAGTPIGRLSKDPNEIYRGISTCGPHLVALIEAVIALGDGERRDPKTDEGRF